MDAEHGDPIKYCSVQVEEYTVHIYFEDTGNGGFITEAQHRGVPLAGPYSVIKHKPHIDGGQYHLHLYHKQNQLFAINKDGTAHDKSHGYQIPNKVADALRKQFPDFVLPRHNIIESVNDLTAVEIEILYLLD